MTDTDVPKLEASRKDALQKVISTDLSNLYELDQLIDKDSSLRQQFISNPADTAKSKAGFQVPPGFHLHWIDTNNVYHPAEGSAVDQLLNKPTGQKWIRVEVRVAGGLGGCIALCGVCM